MTVKEIEAGAGIPRIGLLLLSHNSFSGKTSRNAPIRENRL
jgi:hypothetical protein